MIVSRRRLLGLGAALLGVIACSSPTVLPADDAGSTMPGSSLPAGTTSTTVHVRVGPGGISEPRFAGPNIVAFTGDAVIAIDAATLEPEWTSDTCGAPAWPGPYYLAPARVIVVECQGVYTGFDPATGATMWHFDPQETVDQLRMGGNTMTVKSYGLLRVVDLGTGSLRWKIGVGNVGTFVTEDTVYVGSPLTLEALDVETAMPRWRRSLDVTDERVDGDTLYVWAWVGPVPELIALDVRDGTQRWLHILQDDNKTKTAIIGVSEHAIVVARLGTERGYEAFDRNDGHLLWSHVGELEGDHEYKMSVADHAVVLCSPDGDVTAYDDLTATHSVRLGESNDGYCPASGDLVASVAGVDQQQLRVTTIPDL